MNITFSASCRPLHNNTATQIKPMNFYQKFILSAVEKIVNDDTPRLRARGIVWDMLKDKKMSHLYDEFKKVVDAVEKTVPNNVREIAEKAAADAKENADDVYTAAWDKAHTAYLAAYRKAIRRGMDSLVKQLG